MDDITAIVSAYFAKDFIGPRLDNLTAQKPKPEIVAVCQKGSYEENISRAYGAVIVNTEDIPTIYKAWNMAILAASGKYIIIANTDDMLYDGAIYAMSAALDNNPGFCMVYSDVCLQQNGATRLWIRPYAGSSNEFDDLKKKYFIGPMPMWRKSIHEKYGYFDATMKVAGDWEFWLRLAEGGERFYYIPKSLGNYRFRKNSLERREKAAHSEERSRIFKRYRKGIK